jgi:hypothetical protein
MAFRHDRRIDAGDSIAFWAVARRLELDFGAPLFRPADADSTREGLTVVVDHRIPAEGETFMTWNARGELYDGTVAFRSHALLRDPHVATHELLHALGLGHASAWFSLMVNWGTRATRATAEDIGYAQLLYAVRRLQERYEAPYGIAEAEAER